MQSSRGASANHDAEADRSWIAVHGLEKRFESRGRGEVSALEDIDFSVKQREFVSIVGPSGCGKTTLLRILAGLSEASRGSVTIGGHPSAALRRHIGMVFQSPTLLPWRTIFENVMVPVEVQRLDRKSARRRARDLLELVGLAGFEDSYPHELSGGMQQRAGICRALIHDPDVLLMDEPFGAVDAMTREFMNLELLRIWRESEKTVLVVTHAISEAVFLSDRVIVMTPRPGRIAESVSIGLDRPRELKMMSTDEAGVFVERIRGHFGSMAALG